MSPALSADRAATSAVFGQVAHRAKAWALEGANVLENPTDTADLPRGKTCQAPFLMRITLIEADMSGNKAQERLLKPI
jgi:hypothetical protein